MKKTAIAFAAAFFCTIGSARPVVACGDKFLFLSRIYRHHPLTNNTVAVFARPNSLLAKVAASHMDEVFQQEGYHLLLLTSDRDLAMAIQSHAADLVIADIADVTAIEPSALAAKIPIIPVIKKNDARSEAEAKHYLAVVKSPVKPDNFLDALGRAFQSKEMHENHTTAQVSSVSLR